MSLLYECNVEYSFSEHAGLPVEAHYTRVHIPSGAVQERKVYTANREDALVLMNWWNREPAWKFHCKFRREVRK